MKLLLVYVTAFGCLISSVASAKASHPPTDQQVAAGLFQNAGLSEASNIRIEQSYTSSDIDGRVVHGWKVLRFSYKGLSYTCAGFLVKASISSAEGEYQTQALLNNACTDQNGDNMYQDTPLFSVWNTTYLSKNQSFRTAE